MTDRASTTERVERLVDRAARHVMSNQEGEQLRKVFTAYERVRQAAAALKLGSVAVSYASQANTESHWNKARRELLAALAALDALVEKKP